MVISTIITTFVKYSNSILHYFITMVDDLKKLVGRRLQILRLERNLTQERMGEMLSLSTSAYCKIEYGETDLTLTRLNKIAEIFNISANELFNQLDNSMYVNKAENCGFVGIAKDSSTVRVDNNDDLRELVKVNAKLIDSVIKRLDLLEERIK